MRNSIASTMKNVWRKSDSSLTLTFDRTCDCLFVILKVAVEIISIDVDFHVTLKAKQAFLGINRTGQFSVRCLIYEWKISHK